MAKQGLGHVQDMPTVVGSGIKYRKVLKIGIFGQLLYFSGTSDVQEKGKSIPLALSNAAASSTFGDSSDDEQAILIVKGSNLRRCMLDRGGAQWPEHRKLDWQKLQARPA